MGNLPKTVSGETKLLQELLLDGFSRMSHISHLSENILIIPKTLGKVFCGLMRQNDFTPTVKYALGSAMVWSCFSTSRPGRLVITEPWKHEFCSLPKIHKGNARPSVRSPELKLTRLMRQSKTHQQVEVTN